MQVSVPLHFKVMPGLTMTVTAFDPVLSKFKVAHVMSVLTVTVAPGTIVATSLLPGIEPPTHVEASSQFPPVLVDVQRVAMLRDAPSVANNTAIRIDQLVFITGVGGYTMGRPYGGSFSANPLGPFG